MGGEGGRKKSRSVEEEENVGLVPTVGTRDATLADGRKPLGASNVPSPYVLFSCTV